MHAPRALAAAVLLAAAALPAQQTKVVPAGAAAADAGTLSVYPFGYVQGRLQVVVDAKALCFGSAILNGLAFRRDENSAITGFTPRQIPSLKLSLSMTAATAGSMSSTFAANITGTPTVVFQGVYNLPAQPNVSPAPFNIQWTWTQPFLLIKAQGNLLVDVEIVDTPSKSSYFVDAENMTGSTPGAALVYGSAGSFVGGDPYSVGCPTPAGLVPGGSLVLQAAGLKSGYPALAAFGRSRTSHGPLALPFDLGVLGAPGNFLQAELFLLQGLPLALAGGAWGGSVSLPVPAQSWLAGLKLYGQAFFVDPPSNALGLVLSQGVDYTLGFMGPVMQMCGSYDPLAQTGSLTTHAVVTQFTGVFN